MDRSNTLTVQTNQDHKTEKSNAVSPTTQRQSPVKPSPDTADSNKKVIELHQNQAEIETLEKLTVEQRQLLAKNLSLREQLQQSQQLKQQLLKDLADREELYELQLQQLQQSKQQLLKDFADREELYELQQQQLEQLKQRLLKDMAESKAKVEEYTTVIRNHRMMVLRRGLDDFNRG